MDNNTPDQTTQEGVSRRRFLKLSAGFGAAALTASTFNGLAMAKDAIIKPAAPKTPKIVDLQNIATVYNASQAIPIHEFPNLETVEGLSKNQIDQHLALYHGYVNGANKLTETIREFNATSDAAQFRAMHIDQSYALNGALLHQYYFENMGGAHTPPSEWFKDLIAKEFSSWDNYVSQFNTLGKKFRGWVVTGYNMLDHRIHNYGLDSHNEYYPAHVMPILVMDVYEHAYMIDFGTDRGKYLEAFVNNIDWAVVEARLKTMTLHYVPHAEQKA